MQETVLWDGRRLSHALICRLARMKTQTYASVKRGENPNLYAYYSVFRVYRLALERSGKAHLLPAICEKLHRALEEDFKSRHNLQQDE